MAINWQDIGVQVGILGGLFALYHTFILDNHLRKLLEEDKGAKAIIGELIETIVDKKLVAFRKEEINPLLKRIDALHFTLSGNEKDKDKEIKELTKELARLSKLLELRMSKRKEELAEQAANTQMLSQFISFSISVLGSTVFNLKRRSEDFIKHYNIHNRDGEDFPPFSDHTHEDQYNRFIDNLFSPRDPLTRAIASQKRDGEDSGFFPRPSYKDTFSGGDDTTQNL